MTSYSNNSQIIKRHNAAINTSKESSRRAQSKSTELLERAGYIADFGSGLYGLTTLGQETRNRIENVIRHKHIQNGCMEVSLPSLQYSDDWKKSGRWDKFEGEMFTFKNRNGSEMCLAPTHEEGIVRMFRDIISSYKDLPVTVFQIKEKHRDDKARQGLLRGKEFVMKDAYSMHDSKNSMYTRYQEIADMYREIFRELGLEVAEVSAQVGVMGGSKSMEFVAPSESGDDNLVYCQDCEFGVTDEHNEYEDYSSETECPECGGSLTDSNGVEVGHIFALSQRYSDAMNFNFDTEGQGTESVYMASYGIGVTRLIQTLIDQNGVQDSCQWEINNQSTCSPFDICIIQTDGIDASTIQKARDSVSGLRCLEYEQNINIGEQFSESDLIGIPVKIIFGNHWLLENEVEIELYTGENIYCELNELEEKLSDIYDI